MEHTPRPGYLATPPSNQGDPVLVLHAWWGLNDTIKAFCDRLAEAGFIAFAPDLYHGRLAVTIPEAEALSDALEHEAAKDDIARAVDLLVKRAGSPIAVIGFSLGAFLALELSVTEAKHIRKVVVFYGTRALDDYMSSRAAYLGHFAESDEFEPPAEVKNMEEVLRRVGQPATFHTYPGTGHWFFEPDRPDAYNEAAAELAWERTLAFLRA
jgi:carboxymethylenebutenolidase